MVSVELIYIAIDQTCVHIKLSLPLGARVGDALDQSGLFITHPELKSQPLGIFAKRVTKDTLLKSGDRIEIYRPLQNDPKEKRRQRAKKG